MKKATWRTGPVPKNFWDTMLAVIETNHGPEFYLCRMNDNGLLIDPDTGDDIGWFVIHVDRWCPLEDICKMLEGEK
jgi:hypothetical protein